MNFTLARSKDAAAVVSIEQFESLMRQTHRQAYGLAFRLTSNVSEAEDLTQETYLRAYRFFGRYDSSLPFTSWLFRIMTNAHIDMVRRRGKLKTVSLDNAGSEGDTPWEFADTAATPDREMMTTQMEEPLEKGLQSMNPEFRTAVILADVEGMAYEEIADVMQTSVGTVRSRIHRGRKFLKSHLTKNQPDYVRRYINEL